MEMLSMTLLNKSKAKSSASCLPWTTKDSNTITAISHKNTWMQKTPMKIWQKKDAEELSCIVLLTSSILILYNAVSFRQINLTWYLIPSILTSKLRQRVSNQIPTKTIKILSISVKISKDLFSLKTCTEIWARTYWYRFWMCLTRTLTIEFTTVTTSRWTCWGDWRLLRFFTTLKGSGCLRGLYTARLKISMSW